MVDFARVWLIVVGVAMAVGGTMLALLGGTRLLAFLDRLIDPAFWHDTPDASTRRYQAWIYGVLGGTMAGWGLTVALLAASDFAARETWLWWTIASGTALWFVVDTGQSLRFRVWANVALNAAVLIAVAIPLALTFGEFN
jgi:hypothetical protein